jgi:zinc/manganese transport system permease protein
VLQDTIQFLALPFLAAVIFVGIHAYLGLHVLRRGIVFADLALAQLSALGATVAFAAGHAPTSPAGLAYTLLFTILGAVLLTASRAAARAMSQEAFIGILYVVATSATILVVDRSPQGAEHVKRILVGGILAVQPLDLVEFAAVYGAIGLLHWLARRPLLALSEADPAQPQSWRAGLWDLVFYVSFGMVVTSSVATAGVLLVFCFLIIPAVIGTLFTRRIAGALVIGWAAGVAASALGLAGSFALDLPTGAALVLAFALALAVAAVIRLFVVVPPARRRARLSLAGRAACAATLALMLAASGWLIAAPQADQPVLAVAEWLLGLGPAVFLDEAERDAYGDAAATAARWQGEGARLDAQERRARWQGAALSEDELRRMGSYQQSFGEMARGELFVMDVLRGKARARERWYVGLPLAAVAVLGLALMARRGILRRF